MSIYISLILTEVSHLVKEFAIKAIVVSKTHIKLINIIENCSAVFVTFLDHSLMTFIIVSLKGIEKVALCNS